MSTPSASTERSALLATAEVPHDEKVPPATQKREKLKKIVISGVGFFSDAYDLFIINIVMIILSQVCAHTTISCSYV
jgi:hypothetical protein